MTLDYEYLLSEIILNSPEDFFFLRLAMQQCHGAHFFYRGHSNCEWILSSSLERLYNNVAKNEGNDYDSFYYGSMNYYENNLLSELQREMPHYLLTKSFPDSNVYAEWFTLIQHYGGKTRLLDFTKSFYIGLFFATHFGQKKIYPKSAVWVINYFSESISEYPEESIEFNYLS